MKQVFIHFWLLPTIADKEILTYWKQQLEETLSQCSNDTRSLFLNTSQEVIDVKKQTNNLQNFVNQVKTANPQIKIFLIFDRRMVEQTELSFENVDDILCLDPYFLWIYYEILTGGKTIEQWNPDNDKLLLLMRRPFEVHRVELLRQLLDAGMENDLKWTLPDIATLIRDFSFKTADDVIDNFLQVLPGLNRKEAKDFVEKNSNFIGKKYNSIQEQRGTVLSEYEELYSSVIGEIVSETVYIQPKPIFITEKTVKPIANHTPFIVVGQPDIEKYLRNMGFCTFEFDNTKTMTEQSVKTLIENNLDPAIFFQTAFYINRFKDFYNNFKDPSWPENIKWNTINTLPINFQVEIIENFFSRFEIQHLLRFHQTIQQIVSFKETLLNNKEEVSKRVEHNAKRFNQVGEQNMSDIKQLLTKNNIELDPMTFTRMLFSTPPENVLLEGYS